MQAAGTPAVISEDALVAGALYYRSQLPQKFQPAHPWGIGQVFTRMENSGPRRPVTLYCTEGRYNGDEIEKIERGEPMRWIFEGGMDENGVQVKDQNTEVGRNKYMRMLINENERKLSTVGGVKFQSRDFFHFFLRHGDEEMFKYMGKVLAIKYEEPDLVAKPSGGYFKTCTCTLCPVEHIGTYMAPGAAYSIADE
jgi:hypothetical protein